MTGISTFIDKLQSEAPIEKEDLMVFENKDILQLNTLEMRLLNTYLRQFDLSPPELIKCIGNENVINETITEIKDLIKIVHDLFDCVRDGRPFDYRARIFLGVVSSYHISIIQEAVRKSDYNVAAFLDSCDTSVNLNRYLRSLVGDTPVVFRMKADFSGKDLANDEIVYESIITVNTSCSNFRMRISNTYELWQITRDNDVAEADTVAWLEDTITDGSVLYDVGACLGFFSIYASSMKKKVSVFSFEPDPANYIRLCTNININNLYDKVLSFPVAVADFSGFHTFKSSGFFSGKAENSYIDVEKPSHISGCVVTTIDHFAESHLPPTHMKIDVDGPEHLVLYGARKTLGSESLRHLIVEGYELSADSMAEFLINFGFREKSHYFSSSFEYKGWGRQANYVYTKDI